MFPRKRLLTLFSTTLLALFGATLWLLAPFNSMPSQAYPMPSTRYVSTTGNDRNNDCSSNLSPCRTLQHAVNQANNGNEILVASGVYTGVLARGSMTQVVYISQTLTLLGGYSSDFNTRNPDIYPTTLDAEGEGRVVSIIGASAQPTLDGFIITGGNAHGVTLDCPPAGGISEGCGGGIFVYQAKATITNNVITGNVAATSTGINSASGGGLCLTYANGSLISGNQFINNTASLGARGQGGAMHLYFPYDVVVIANRILSNTATINTSLPGWGGGISADGGGAQATIQDNWFQGNRTNGDGTGFGASIYGWYSHSDIIGNRLQGNIGYDAIYLGYFTPGRLEGNRVIDNNTEVGVSLVGGTGSISTLANNIIASSGEQTILFKAHSSGPLTANLIHNTLVGEGSGYGVYIGNNYVTLNMTNTLVASYTVGITNTVPTSSSVNASHTLFWGNQDNGITGASPVYGDPRFVNPSGGDFHLLPGSAAIDVGILTSVATDIDGDPRPLGLDPDIGADEFTWRLFLPMVLCNY